MAKIGFFLFFLSAFASEISERSLGISPRNIALSPENLKKFTQVGIALTLNPQPEPEPLTPWEKGLLFLSDFNRKGDLFQKWLEISPIRPNKLLVIDQEKRK